MTLHVLCDSDIPTYTFSDKAFTQQNRLPSVSVAKDVLRPHVCTLCYFHDKLREFPPSSCHALPTGSSRRDAVEDARTRSSVSARSPSMEEGVGNEGGQKTMRREVGGGMSTWEISRYLANLGAEMLKERTRVDGQDRYRPACSTATIDQRVRPATVDLVNPVSRGNRSIDTLRPSTSSSFFRRRDFKLRLDAHVQLLEEEPRTEHFLSQASSSRSFIRRQEANQVSYQEAKDRRLRNFSLGNVVKLYISSRGKK